MPSPFFALCRPPPRSTLFPYTTLFRSLLVMLILGGVGRLYGAFIGPVVYLIFQELLAKQFPEYWFASRDRKSTRLNSSHVKSSYAVFCLKKKKVEVLPAGAVAVAFGLL